MYSFLLIGQSNMAGRGNISDVAPIDNAHIHVLRNGRWLPMFTPVNFDRKASGVCLAESFADLVAKEYQVDVGLIPCADGGTALRQWMPGEVLYDNAVNQARLAARTSTIAGVLWHQGESDCAPDLYPYYEEKCTYIFNSLRKDLDLSPDVPFVVGGLGDYLKDCQDSPVFANYIYVNEALKQMAASNEYIGFVSAQGLTCNSDYLHFDARSLRVLGKRYYEVFKKMNPFIQTANQKPAENTLTAIEQL